MRLSKMSLVVGGIAVLVLIVGLAGALAEGPVAVPGLAPAATGDAVAGAISYQGRLTNPDGAPLAGDFPMRFRLYNDAAGGSSALVWDSAPMTVPVQDGLFAVRLEVPTPYFDGQALWLAIEVDGETLTPFQEILPAPYALGLRPYAKVTGHDFAPLSTVLEVLAPATGTALHGYGDGGTGVSGYSANSYAVRGSSYDSSGGYFESTHGTALRALSGGTRHYDHGAHVTTQGGYGLYAESAQNHAVRGEAGNVVGAPRSAGKVGVAGIGEGLGTFGGSQQGAGVYGFSGTSNGVRGGTSRNDNNYGLFTYDNLYSLNFHLAGAMMQVMQNGGHAPLAPGDLVAFGGINREVKGVDGPLVQVRQADGAQRTAVAGVVFSRFNIDAVDASQHDLTIPAQGGQEVTPAGSAAAGEFVLVVVQGPAQVRASALGGSITPGDLLSAGDAAGMAGRAPVVALDGVETARPGTVFAKALEPLEDAEGMIYVYVTLQ